MIFQSACESSVGNLNYSHLTSEDLLNILASSLDLQQLLTITK